MVTIEFCVASLDRRRAAVAPLRGRCGAACPRARRSGCSMFDQFNPFGARKIQDGDQAGHAGEQDLRSRSRETGQRRAAGAAKKFTELGKQYPNSDWARKGQLMTTYANYQAGDYTDAETSAERYLKDYPNSPDAAYVLYLQANLLHANTRYFARPGERVQGPRGVPGDREEVPEVGICRGLEIQDPGHAGPARRQGNVDRPLLSQSPQLHRGDQPLPQRSSILPDNPPRRRGAVSAGRGLYRPWHHRRGARPRRRFSATISPTANGTRTPTTF